MTLAMVWVLPVPGGPWTTTPSLTSNSCTIRTCARQVTVTLGPAQLFLPVPATLDPMALGLAVLAGWLILRRHWSLPLTLGLSASLSLLLTAVTTGL